MTSAAPTPLALIAELTHRCPLHCVYCSNPVELGRRADELSTEVWSRVFREAAEAGVLQVDFTGGEPLARTDIVELVRAAREAGYDLERVLTRDDLVAGNDVFFSATGVTDGDVLEGVRYPSAGGATTESLVTRSRSGTIRRIRATHDRAKLRAIAGERYSRGGAFAG